MMIVGIMIVMRVAVSMSVFVCLFAAHLAPSGESNPKAETD